MATNTDVLNWAGLLLSGGRYEVKAKLGEGGMGFVYRARHRKLDTDVVIKVPRPALLQDPEFAARFSREIRALVKLEHPHVVKIIDVDDHGGVPFAVMSYLAGGSLENRQPLGPQRQPLPTPPEELADWLAPIASALDYVHKRGFVHRDVKPANILFDGQGHVYLSDFGVAKAVAETQKGQLDSLTGTGVVLGTPQYMAPEMALGQQYDGRVDQYALGVTVYEMLSGRVPFSGSTAAAILLKQTTEEPRPLHVLCDSVPRAVSEAVHRALAKDPAKRYPNCVAMAKEILAAVAASPRQGNSLSTIEHQTSRVPVISCPQCSKTHRLPPTAWGKRVKCPVCLHEFQGPAAPSSQSAPTKPDQETGKVLQVRVDTSPHRAAPAPEPKAEPAGRPSNPLKPLLLVSGALVLLAVLAGTGFLVSRAFKPVDGGDVRSPSAATQERPVLLLGYNALTLEPGDKKDVEVTIERHGFQGPIELEVTGLPRKVSYSLPRLPAERSMARLELVVAADAPDGESTARVVARLGDVRLEDSLKLSVLRNRDANPTGYERPIPGSIRFEPLGDVSLMAGSSASVDVRIRRTAYEGPIVVQLAGEPGELEAQPLMLGPGQSSGKLELRAQSNMPAGLLNAHLSATTSMADVTDSAQFRVRITLAPEPRLAEVAPITLAHGERKKVSVKLQRNGWTGRCGMSFDKLPDGISVTEPAPAIAEGQDTVQVELACNPSALEGDYEGRIVGNAGGRTITTPLRIKVQSLNQLHAFAGHARPVWYVAFQNPQTAISLGEDQTARVLDLARKEEKRRIVLNDLSPAAHRQQVSLSTDGRWCAFAAAVRSGGVIQGPIIPQVQIWDLDQGKEKIRFLGKEGPQKAVAWTILSGNGRWVLCGSLDEFMRLYDAALNRRDPPAGGGPNPTGVEYAAFVPSFVGGRAEGTPLLPGNTGGFNSGPGFPLPGAGAGRNWKPNALVPGKFPHVVYGRQGGDLSFRDLDKNQELGRCTGHSDRIWCVAFAPDGSLAASASADRTVRVWDLQTFKEAARFNHEDEVYAVAFSPDARRIVSGGKDQSVRVWDLATQQQVRKYDEHAGAVTCVACSPDNAHIVSGSLDKTVRLWAMPK